MRKVKPTREPRHVFVRREVLRALQGMGPVDDEALPYEGRRVRGWLSHAELLLSPECREMKLNEVEAALKRLEAEGLVYYRQSYRPRLIHLVVNPSTWTTSAEPAAASVVADFGSVTISMFDALSGLRVEVRTSQPEPAKVLMSIAVFAAEDDDASCRVASETYDRSLAHFTAAARLHGINLTVDREPVGYTGFGPEHYIVGYLSGAVVGRTAPAARPTPSDPQPTTATVGIA